MCKMFSVCGPVPGHRFLEQYRLQNISGYLGQYVIKEPFKKSVADFRRMFFQWTLLNLRFKKIVTD